ncbi:MAG: hypothetical protein IJS03_05095 [Eubacterium sp.]|nr:hypothetical protein [Eubacterium sp.]
MIIVDIYVPVVNKVYDFSINEKLPVSVIVEELSEMIAQKEGCMTIEHPENFVLCRADTKSIMNADLTVESYGIGNGAKLILV